MSATDIILALTIVASIVGFSSGKLLALAVMRPYAIARGTGYFTLLTHGFVHADVIHLLFNLITLWSFGSMLEQRIGTGAFVLLYFCGLLISSIGTCIKHRDEQDYASLGASSAILAVLFASIIYFPGQRIMMLLIPIPIPAPLFAVAFLAYSYYSSGRRTPGPLGRNINYDAHIIGALTGLVFVALTDPRQYQVLLHSMTG
jgi:membrane associated rhomboid family serine protease